MLTIFHDQILGGHSQVLHRTLIEKTNVFTSKNGIHYNNYNKILSQYEFQKDTQGNFKAKCRHCPTYTHLVVRKSLPISRLLKRYVNVL